MRFSKPRLIFNHLIHWLLPSACILCGQETKSTRSLCYPCENDLPTLPNHCPRCARFLTLTDTDSSLCGACLNETPPFDCTRALFPYVAPIASLITGLKFQHRLHYSKALGELFAAHLSRRAYQHHPLPDLILPIPLHPDRLKERGFNQSLEITKTLSSLIHIPYDAKSLKRARATTSQSTLKAKERKHNVKGAFQLTGHYAGRSIAVLDDVITTASTMTEACRLLKEQGARRVEAWCIARRG